LQIVRPRLARNRRDVEKRKSARLGEPPPQLVAQADEARLLVGARAAGFAFEARVDQLEIKGRDGLCAARGALGNDQDP
jgi:hypothetical protein